MRRLNVSSISRSISSPIIVFTFSSSLISSINEQNNFAKSFFCRKNVAQDLKFLFMFGFCPLASGSKGNCLYLGSATTRVLIDAGISLREICKRLEEIQVDLQTIQAVFVTHEHSDHIKGLPLLSQKLNIPIIANNETATGISHAIQAQLRFKIFTTGETFQFGDLAVHPFSIPHDTLDPVGFIIQMDHLKLGICTDIGHVTSLVAKHLENRILGKQGHLSNEDCAKLIAKIMHPHLKHVYLAHLSEECNSQEVALKIVKESLPYSISVTVAHQDQVSQPVAFSSKTRSFI